MTLGFIEACQRLRHADAEAYRRVQSELEEFTRLGQPDHIGRIGSLNGVATLMRIVDESVVTVAARTETVESHA